MNGSIPVRKWVSSVTVRSSPIKIIGNGPLTNHSITRFVSTVFICPPVWEGALPYGKGLVYPIPKAAGIGKSGLNSNSGESTGPIVPVKSIKRRFFNETS
jgi:hypothetical protein